MIIGVHLPLLTLVRIEACCPADGHHIVFALIGCLFFALLAVPALACLIFPRVTREWENPLLRIGKPIYISIIAALVRWRWLAAPVVRLMLAWDAFLGRAASGPNPALHG